MIDDVLLTAIRRFWTTAEVSTRYETILAAYLNRVEKVTIIVGKTTGDDSANAQVVIAREDYREWLATLEARLSETEAEVAGTGTTHSGTEHVVHNNRYVST
jgi:hypothetical protein